MFIPQLFFLRPQCVIPIREPRSAVAVSQSNPYNLIICATPRSAESCGMRPQKITFGEMRAAGGPTGILVYCADYRCSHSIAISADQWPDDVRLSDIEPRFDCTACGKRGADVRGLKICRVNPGSRAP